MTPAIMQFISSALTSVQVSPISLITLDGVWNIYTYIYLIIYFAIFIICVILSLSNYDSDDPTPYGYRLIYAISAGMWNIIYLVYALFT
jgi:hypothetical protein